MPVTVQDYTWSETIDEVVITIPLKGVKPSKADIFSSDDIDSIFSVEYTRYGEYTIYGDDYVKVCCAHSTTA